MQAEKDALVKASSRDDRVSSRLEALTINKLDLSSLGLFGRSREQKQLKDCLERLVRSLPKDNHENANDSLSSPHGKGPSKELVLVHGLSGSGKTALAATLQDPIKLHRGLFVLGKFDPFLREQPLAGIASVCRAVVGELLHLKASNLNRFDEVKYALEEEFGISDFLLLKRIVPELDEIVTLNTHTASASEDPITGNQDALIYSFLRFFRIICSFFAPLIVALEDVQDIDIASLELLQALLTCRLNQGLMITATYRSNEVDENHPFCQAIKDLQSKQSKYHLEITNIPVDNLDVENVNSILQDVLGSQANTHPLAEICHKRTLGNPFFVLSFLRMLHDEGLLKYNLGLMQWKWDAEMIEQETAASPNVVVIVRNRMNHCSPEVIQLLQLAACMGSSFDETILGKVWQAAIGAKAGRVEEILASVTDEPCFLEKKGGTQYRWVHDKIREAAMSLIPEDKVESFKFQLGQNLLSQLSDSQVERFIFVVVNLLNCHDEPSLAGDSTEAPKIAKLNLRAANRAVESSAFQSASRYAAKGIQLLKSKASDLWRSDQYKLILDLHSVGAEAESSLGNPEKLEEYCRIVLEQGNISTLEKLRVYNVKMELLANTGKVEDAIELCLDVLGQLGCKFPRSTFMRGVKGFTQLYKLKGPKNLLSEDTIARLPIMSDRTKEESMKLLNKLAVYCYISQNFFLFILIATRRARWTLRYGICPNSPPSFAQLGGVLLFGVMGDMRTASSYCKHALTMNERLGDRALICDTLFQSYGSTRSWTEPWPDATQSLRRSYECGMVAGETETSMWALQFYLEARFLSGKSLALMAKDCRTFIPQMHELKKEEAAECVKGLLKLIQDLVDADGMKDESNTSITNISSGVASMLSESLDDGWSPYTRHASAVHRLLACLYLGEYELGAKMAIDKGDSFLKEMPGNFLGMVDAFARGICMSAAVRSYPKSRHNKKYKASVKALAAKMKTWVQEGAINGQHQAMLLQAEEAAMLGKNDQASKYYRNSIVLASRGGLIHDAGLAHERFGNFLLNVLGDKEGATFELNEAIQCFLEWGATRTVERIRTVYEDLLAPPSLIK